VSILIVFYPSAELFGEGKQGGTVAQQLWKESERLTGICFAM